MELKNINLKDVIMGQASNEVMTDDELDNVAGGTAKMKLYYAKVGDSYRCIAATGLAAYSTLTKDQILGLIDGKAPKGLPLSSFMAGEYSEADAAQLVDAINKNPKQFSHIEFHDYNSLK